MNPPRRLTPYDDRLLDCEEALEDDFLRLVDRACDHGWNATEIAVAITNLADNLILKLAAQDETCMQILAAKFKRP